jgi:hypothetical protein
MTLKETNLSGILEAIHAELQAIRAALAQGAPQHQPAPQQQPQQYVQQQPPPQQYVQQQPVQQAPPQANVTAESITSLIQPHISNQAIKDALGNAMRAMGINALPETQPHQYGELYARFQQVIAQFAGGAPPVQQQPASII